MQLWKLITGVHQEESGQDALEYALVLAAAISVVVAGSSSLASLLSNSMTTIVGKIQSQLQ